MAFCLIPSLAEKLKQAVINGQVDPNVLMDMSPKQQHEFFARLLGEENAGPVTALIQSKMLLKNQEAGFITAINKLITNPEVKKDLLSKVKRLDKVLTPEEADAFMDDLVAQKFGFHVSYDEAQTIAKLAKTVDETESAMQGHRRTPGGRATEQELAYGRAVHDFAQYTNDLKLGAEKMSLKEALKNPGEAISKFASSAAGNSKSINASMDNSSIFRQGWKTLWTNPIIWSRNAYKTFVDIVKTFGGKDTLRELNASIISDPNYDLMKKAKLSVGIHEEAYPTSLPEKIGHIPKVKDVPILGHTLKGVSKTYKASEAAYTGFVQKTRVDVFNKMVEIAQKTGVELTDRELQSIGKMVNSLTSRAHLGRVEPVGDFVNNFFFSPRLLKSHFDVLLNPVGGAGGSNFVRKQAALNLLKIISGTTAVLVTANALKPGSVEKDPRSSDFGKIKVGNTRFEMTGGMSSIVTLAARLLPIFIGQTPKTKSTTTGKLNEINAKDKDGKPKFGASTGTDVAIDFLSNKLSPVARVIWELANNADFSGNPPTAKNITKNLATPFIYRNYEELKNDPDAANMIVALLADALGISINTYGPKK